jgi:hypothetical protein
LNNLFGAITKASKHQVLIMRDFNFPNINWATFDSDAASSLISDRTLNDYLHQHVSVLTGDNNILNLVLTSEEAMVENSQCWDQ